MRTTYSRFTLLLLCISVPCIAQQQQPLLFMDNELEGEPVVSNVLCTHDLRLGVRVGYRRIAILLFKARLAAGGLR